MQTFNPALQVCRQTFNPSCKFECKPAPPFACKCLRACPRAQICLQSLASFRANFQPRLASLRANFQPPLASLQANFQPRLASLHANLQHRLASLHANFQPHVPNYLTSSTAQGGGGSFKNRKPIGEIGCCESRMAERIH